MKNIKEVIVDNEKVYLRKDFLGWHTTNPIKIDGKINWKNLIAGGSWLKLILVAIFVLIMVFAIIEYVESLRFCSELIANRMNPTEIIFEDINLTFNRG